MRREAGIEQSRRAVAAIIGAVRERRVWKAKGGLWCWTTYLRAGKRLAESMGADELESWCDSECFLDGEPRLAGQTSLGSSRYSRVSHVVSL